MARNLNPYSKTPVTSSGYLDILKPIAVPSAGDDVLYTIQPAYNYRPDLLAYDLYGQKQLWWVFAQRNPNILKDPIFDFIAGTEIYLPQGKNLRERLNY